MSRRRSLSEFDPERPGPYLKWAGNKAFLASPKHIPHVPEPAPGSYWGEPFCGAAGLFLSMPPDRRHRARLSDINPRIVGTHIAVRDQVEDVIERLTSIRAHRHAIEAGGDRAELEGHYYGLRDRFNAPDLEPHGAESAALMIAINHLCMNGLFRENNEGQFNVAIGDYKKPALFDAEHLRACSRILAAADLRVLDCEVASDEAAEGDALLLDPPYDPVSETAAFTGYSARRGGDWSVSSKQESFPGFGLETKRQRLAKKLPELHARGVRFLLTDADTSETRGLYREWAVHTILVPRTMSRDGANRRAVSEILVTNRRRQQP